MRHRCNGPWSYDLMKKFCKKIGVKKCTHETGSCVDGNYDWKVCGKRRATNHSDPYDFEDETEAYNFILDTFTRDGEWANGAPFTLPQLAQVFCPFMMNGFGTISFTGTDEIYWVVTDDVNKMIENYKKEYSSVFTPWDNPHHTLNSTVVIPIHENLDEELSGYFDHESDDMKQSGPDVFAKFRKSYFKNNRPQYSGIMFKNDIIVYPKRVVYVSTKHHNTMTNWGIEGRGHSLDTYVIGKGEPDGKYVKKIGGAIIVREGFEEMFSKPLKFTKVDCRKFL